MTKKTETQTIKGEDVGNATAVLAASAAPAGGKETIQTPAAVNKSAIATAIFDECYKMSPVPQRKDILARVKQEAGLTDAGAATYLQNYKRKHNLSKSPAQSAPAADAAPATEGDKAE
jgi:hypothetical protein